MADIGTLSNHFKYQVVLGNINFSSDVFKIILMKDTFTFDKDEHAILSDVATSQLESGNGYAQNDKILTGVSITEDDDEDRSKVTWDDPVWTASGGNIGPTSAAIIYDDTTEDYTVIGCITFEVPYTVEDGSNLSLTNIIMSIT